MVGVQRLAESLVYYIFILVPSLPWWLRGSFPSVSSCAVKTPVTSEKLSGARRIYPTVPAGVFLNHELAQAKDLKVGAPGSFFQGKPSRECWPHGRLLHLKTESLVLLAQGTRAGVGRTKRKGHSLTLYVSHLTPGGPVQPEFMDLFHLGYGKI